MFKSESSALECALGIKKVIFYEVRNDGTSPFKMVTSLFFPLLHCLRILKIVKKNKVDVVHVHNDFPQITLWIFRFLRGQNCVRIQTLHNYRHWCINGILYRTKKGVCEQCVERKSRLSAVLYGCYRKSRFQSLLVVAAYWIQDFFKIVDEVDAFFCLSNHQKMKLIDFGVDAKKIFLKPNFIDISTVGVKKNIEIIYVGRIDESKGILKILDALNSETKAKVVIVGHADNLVDLKLKYPEVNFLGKKSHSDTLQLIQMSRFLIHPSLCYETFGLTILEAMAAGTPVIGFPIGTRNDFIQNGVNGFLINECTIQMDIAAALAYQDYSVLVSNSIQTSSHFLKKHVLRQQVMIYEELSKRSRKIML